MKFCILVWSALVALTGNTYANTVYEPGQERPIFQARMNITESYGSFLNARDAQLVMLKRDGAKLATTFKLSIDGRAMTLAITEANPISGGTEYLAVRKQDFQGASPDSMKLVLREGSGKWTATLRHVEDDGGWAIFDSLSRIRANAASQRILGRLNLSGEPKGVMTIQ